MCMRNRIWTPFTNLIHPMGNAHLSMIRVMRVQSNCSANTTNLVLLLLMLLLLLQLINYIERD